MRTRYLGGLCLIILCMGSLCFGVTGVTNTNDVSSLNLIRLLWENTEPPSWISGTDPCDSQWDGVTCTDGRITSLILSSVGLKGSLSNQIGSLSALQTLDLSYNTELTGRLPGSIGNLVSLKILMMIGCNFIGQIPSALGNLTNLSFLALNSNKFTGPIPATLGKLTNLEWLDLADNQLAGSLPVSNSTQSGLDKLVNANHFHFNLNNLSGTIPPVLFSGNMNLLHVLFDSNEFEGQIPSTLGLVTSLTVLRLDRNQITGSIPSNISNLVSLEELNLSNNRLNGTIPDLSTLTGLGYIDLSNNSFNSATVPSWLTNTQKLTTIVMDNCSIAGQISSTIFSLPALETVRMKSNRLNGTVTISATNSNQVRWIDLRNNSIAQAVVQDNTTTLWIAGNPACNSGSSLSSSESCQNMVQVKSYETVTAQCGNKNCPGELKHNPKTCKCQQPYKGQMVFRAPSFSDITDTQRFKGLENDLIAKLGVDTVYLCCLNFDSTQYLIATVQFFPADSKFFTRSEVNQIGFKLSNQVYKPPTEFGPYLFMATPYIIGSEESSKGISSAVIAGIAVGAVVLALAVIVVGFYALRQRKRAEKAIEIHKPFASWGASSMDDGNAPKLKGARWFSFAELKEATNNFSESNEIGSGGYGRVYRAVLPEGEMVAIKRAQEGSLQGGAEFKNEIELLSRVHHKNLVGLIGFCTEKGEQMLVYEYIPNGTLRENLIGELTLDWARRLQIALGSAKGLNYLHELANPPIIHRDIKSTNILLDEYLNAKVADFGLSKLVADGGVNAGGKSHVSTQVKGTLGYLDPEYYMTQQLSEKSDVYSFGIVLLELITARLPIEGGKYIVRLVKEALDSGGIAWLQEDLMDPALKQDNLTGFGEFLGLALSCVKELGAERPSMRGAVKELESIVEMQGPYSSVKDSPESDPIVVKGTRKLYDEDDEEISMVLPGQGKDNHRNLFEYSGAYQVSGTIEPK
ncbi:leucine-rich repeat receptor protein kinase HPCA1 [Cryptomeria japonica]|uniref:leucine-rich repeat receptor protein kinase HPCA1 n=1 Tax=Cryptomeria japonica TaxID=3369 RepID=UPI0027DA02BC|nr:leucine-rich repeat receptor protein kinase HPCA1 [Cryptomeria japonica]